MNCRILFTWRRLLCLLYAVICLCFAILCGMEAVHVHQTRLALVTSGRRCWIFT
jgi:hypothetical protein